MTERNGDVEGLAARKAALALLVQVLERGQPLDHILEREASFMALPARDRAFVRMLVATAMRRKGQMDDLIVRAASHGEMVEPATLRLILYIGITQLLFMDVPDHAAVDLSVRLAEGAGLVRQKGFVNAILRRMTGAGREWLKAQGDGAMLNVPDWIRLAWEQDYGADVAAEIARASLAEASLDITVKNPAETALWEGALSASALPTGTLRRTAGGDVRDFPGYMDGAWWVQDAAAALPALLFGDVAGKTVVDLCAAPGGKTAQLAACGARVIAVDRSAARMRTLAQNMDRLKLADRVDTVVADGTAWRPGTPVDAVLLDAPCTATGTVRRHPDVLHLKGPDDVRRLADLQARLLDNVAEMLGAGGVLVYCTCSLQKAEGEEQIAAFLERHPDFIRKSITPDETGGVEAFISPEGDLRILPFMLAAHGGMDGFYAARLCRT